MYLVLEVPEYRITLERSSNFRTLNGTLTLKVPVIHGKYQLLVGT